MNIRQMQLIGVIFFLVSEVEFFVSKNMPLVGFFCLFVSPKSIFKSYLVSMLCNKYWV